MPIINIEDPLTLETFEVVDQDDITVSILASLAHPVLYRASTDVVAEVRFSVYDPQFRMLRNRFFSLGREIRFNGRSFLVTRIDVQAQEQEMVRVLARARESQILRFDKGRESFGQVSPTEVAGQIAARLGLNFVGEPSPVTGTIQKVQQDFQDENSFDLITRLGRGLQFHTFTTGDTLYFASQRYILENNGSQSIVLRWPVTESDPFSVLRMDLSKSEENRLSATLTAELVRDVNSVRINPGMSVEVPDLYEFPGEFMVDSVEVEIYPGTPVRFRATRTSEDGLSLTPRDVSETARGRIG